MANDNSVGLAIKILVKAFEGPRRFGVVFYVF